MRMKGTLKMPVRPRSLHLTAVVPVYNEEHLVGSSLRRLAAIATSPLLSRLTIVVVDDGSQDASWDRILEFAGEVRRRPKLAVLTRRHECNGGKGAAVRTGVDLAEGDVTVIHDADLEYDPQDLLSIVRVFLDEDADAVFGSRFLSGQYRRVLYYHHELGNRFLTFCTNILTNLNLTDMETCYKAIRTEIFKSIPIEGNSFTIEPELTIKLAKRDARIYEVPIRYSGRTYLEGKKIGPIDGIRAFLAMVRFTLTDKLYREDPHGSRILARLSRAHRYNRWMAESIRPFCGERVIEIGAGIGTLTRLILPRPLYYATDINREYLRRLSSSFGNRPYLSVARCDVTRRETFPRPAGLFDTAICLNVVEHIEDDVAALRNISGVLQAGGRAIVLAPNIPWLFSRMDAVVGHRRRYTRATLAAACEKAGFKVERILPFNRLGTVAWLFNKLLGRSHFGLGQVWMLNALTPIIRVTDWFMPLPPLSLIAVLKKG
jgi:glycosyltransferase involved in cell wall biosynthesis